MMKDRTKYNRSIQLNKSSTQVFKLQYHEQGICSNLHAMLHE